MIWLARERATLTGITLTVLTISRTSPPASSSASRLNTPSGQLLRIRLLVQGCVLTYQAEWPQTAYDNNNNIEGWIGKYFKSCINTYLFEWTLSAILQHWGILIKCIDITSICILPFNLIACSLYNLDWKKDIAKYNGTFMKLSSELVTIRERAGRECRGQMSAGCTLIAS